MPDVHISIRDVERLRTKVADAKKTLLESAKGVSSASDHADWKDANSRKFDQEWAKVKNNIDSAAKDLDLLHSFLGKVVDHAKQMGR